MSFTAPTLERREDGHSNNSLKFGLIAVFLLVAGLWFSWRALLSTDFLPHWYCYVGNARLLWTNVIADLLIAISYLTISVALAWLARRAGRNLPYSGLFWAFGFFIVSCGATHFLEVVTVWKPVYWLSAALKGITAFASVGTATVLFLVATDIVDFVRTAREAAIRLGNERYKALIQAVPMAVVGADLEKKVTDWNPAAEELFGWTARETVGQPPPFVPNEKDKERTELMKRSLSGEVVKGLETFRINRKGERVAVSLSTAPVYDEVGRISGLIGVFEDIGERKRIQTELQEKTALLSVVTQALNLFLDSGDWRMASKHLLMFAIRQTQSLQGFLGVILDGPILRVLANDGSTWDLPLDGKNNDGKAPENLSAGDSQNSHAHRLLREVLNKGEPFVANSTNLGSLFPEPSPGHPKLNSFLGVPIFKGKQAVGLISVANRIGNYTGQEIRYLKTLSQATGVLHDNYRQNLKRVALEEQQQRLESQILQAQKMEVLGRLAGGVAHDFNNMLMVLNGSSELLEHALPKDSPARVYLGQMQRATEKAAAVTKQLLAFSRKQVLEVRPMDLHEALTECEFMLPRLLGSDILLSFHPDATHSWILSDPAQIEQVVANLAINSRDAMPQGGELTFSTRNRPSLPEGTPDVVEPASRGWVVLEVADTGSGMDEKTKAQIFEPFFTTKPAGKGTGLGLATVYGIVKQSGGYIHVDSAPGKGTRFELYFPCAEPDLSARPSAEPPQVALETGEGNLVLLADDEVALRHAVAEILLASGYKVMEAESADQALEIARRTTDKIDILLTDVVMPSLHGTELARQITAIHPETHVVYMSGYAEGFPDLELPPHSTFLQKPFRFATLLEQLKLVRRKA
jgi:PAS domain S-box-containing protein